MPYFTFSIHFDKMFKKLLQKLKGCVKIKKILIIKTEVYAEEGDQQNNPHSEKKQIHKKEKIMNKLNVNLEQAANYLIQLFYQSGQIYSCTRTKIGKLLSIVAFIYAKKNMQIFNESICKYGDCGTAINELKSYVDRDVYLKSEYSDDEKYISVELDSSAIIPEKHKFTDNVPQNVKSNIEKVFRDFGAFSAYSLGQLIYPIVNGKNMLDTNGNISLLQLYNSKTEDFICTDSNNSLIDYLFTY